jgi:hypothetical protein
MSMFPMSEIPRFDAVTPAQSVTEALLEHGCAIIEALAPGELCDRVEAELRPWIDRSPTGADEFMGLATRRTGALLARSAAAAELIAHPTVLEVAEGVLGGERESPVGPMRDPIQLHVTQAIAIGPGSQPQPLHRDQWCFNFFPFPVGLDVEVSSIWALCDFTEANGATRVVPGSHRSEGMPYTDADAIPAEMPRGSIVLYTGSTVHGGGANTSDQERVGVNVDYVRGWLRQEENQYLSVPREVAAALPERVQRLMGYEKGGYALGYIDDTRDPMEVLREVVPAPTWG